MEAWGTGRLGSHGVRLGVAKEQCADPGCSRIGETGPGAGSAPKSTSDGFDISSNHLRGQLGRLFPCLAQFLP